jgi:acetylornithine/N-succinyldiaminopimelate aminotransferase
MTSALMPTYARAAVTFTRGEGSRLFGSNGRDYIDFAAGIATSSLGHAHPALTRAIAAQAGRLIHVSNLYGVAEAEALASRLVATSFAAGDGGQVFFCNSGAEANEGAVKMMRRAGSARGRWRVLCFEGAFHGRTLAMLAATGNAKYLAGFGPPVDGFDHAPFNDLEAARRALGPETAGILVEPVQGEGGVRPAEPGFLRGLRALCDEAGILLCVDEVQCGMGRTGQLWAHEADGVRPDLLTSAKGIAGGVPMGAIVASGAVAACLAPGSHGSTFGGNPLACAAAMAVLEIVTGEGFLAGVRRRGEALAAALAQLAAEFPAVLDGVRGRGLMLGLACRRPNGEVQQACLEAGVLTVAAGENVLRVVPPLVVSEAEAEEGVARLRLACARLDGA